MTADADTMLDRQEKTPDWVMTPHGKRLLLAFRRLCDGRPEVVPKGAGVSQNNVAREAGLHPTALKRARYPELIELIKQHKEKAPSPPKPTSKRDALQSKSEAVKRLQRELECVKQERDEAQSKLTTVMLEALHLRAKLQRISEEREAKKQRGENDVTSIDFSRSKSTT